jgi:hypothetical protein
VDRSVIGRWREGADLGDVGGFPRLVAFVFEVAEGRRWTHRRGERFIITGGQDNVQGTAGQMLGFFAELGVQFPQFPYIAHSRGWSAEDMENNVDAVRRSEALREGARALVDRCAEMASLMLQGRMKRCALVRGGRKAHRPHSDG